MTMEIFKGIDYSFLPHPTIGQLKAAGVNFVGRYVSSMAANDINGKNLTRSEFEILKKAGMPFILFVEEGAQSMLNGFSEGKAHAIHFDAVCKALGIQGAIAYFVADFDVAPGQQQAIHSYLDGGASVIGRNRTGIYGGYWAVSRALNASKAQWAVQTLAWSGAPRRDTEHDNTFWDGATNWDTRARVRQHLQIRVGTASVDLDGAMFNDFGQWPRPAAPVEPPTVPTQVRADGTLSWRALAHLNGTSLIRSIELTLGHQGGKFGQPRQADIARAGAWNDPLPAGVMIWVG
jgi:hypothetical protein